MTALSNDIKVALTELVLSIADDKFVLGHRVGDWTGLAPILEEDIAFSSIAQDELAHAQALYEIVANLMGTNPDALAYGRSPSDYRCASIVEIADDLNWAVAIARQFFCDHLDALRLTRLASSSYKPLAELASRLAAEEQLHVEHSDAWIDHLGRGGNEARDRIQSALDDLAPLAPMLFEPTKDLDKLETTGVYPAGNDNMFDRWESDLQRVAGQAGLSLCIKRPALDAIGGRRGKHDEAFVELLDELCEVYRTEPEAAW